MDVSTLTQAEVDALQTALNARKAQIRIDEREEQEEIDTRIEGSIATIEALLGPVDAAPGLDSIRAVRGWDGATMATKPELAFPLAFLGLETLAKAVRDIATTIASK